MKVTISRWRLNATLVSEVLSTRFVWADAPSKFQMGIFLFNLTVEACTPSAFDASVNWKDSLRMVAQAIFAHALSRFGFKNRLTINWKPANKIQATINLNAWKEVGSNSALSKIDLPINLRINLECCLQQKAVLNLVSTLLSQMQQPAWTWWKICDQVIKRCLKIGQKMSKP